MSKTRYGKGTNYMKNTEDLAYESVRVYLPVSLSKRLKEISRMKGMPMSRLLAIAMDNELDQEEPFRYVCDIPDDDYVEYEHAHAAGKLLEWLLKMPTGAGVDMMLLARRDIGIFSRESVLRGLRELIEKKMVEAIRPSRAKFGFFHEDYIYWRAIDNGIKRKKMFTRVEGEKQKRLKDEELEE